MVRHISQVLDCTWQQNSYTHGNEFLFKKNCFLFQFPLLLFLTTVNKNNLSKFALHLKAETVTSQFWFLQFLSIWRCAWMDIDNTDEVSNQSLIFFCWLLLWEVYWKKKYNFPFFSGIIDYKVLAPGDCLVYQVTCDYSCGNITATAVTRYYQLHLTVSIYVKTHYGMVEKLCSSEKVRSP